MLPDSTLTVVVFLLLVVPGCVYEAIAGRRRPAADVSAFRETTLVALTSVLFSASAFGVLVIIARHRRTALPDLERWARYDSYARVHLDRVARGAVFEVLIASGFAAAAAIAATGGKVRSYSNWYALFRRQCPSGRTAFLDVRMSDGVRYRGYVGSYTVDDVPPSDRELVLVSPLQRAWPGHGMNDLDRDRLVLPGSQIVDVAVSYVTTSPATKKWRVQWPLRRG
jgi:hypothetical protein